MTMDYDDAYEVGKNVYLGIDNAPPQRMHGSSLVFKAVLSFFIVLIIIIVAYVFNGLQSRNVALTNQLISVQHNNSLLANALNETSIEISSLQGQMSSLNASERSMNVSLNQRIDNLSKNFNASVQQLDSKLQGYEAAANRRQFTVCCPPDIKLSGGSAIYYNTIPDTFDESFNIVSSANLEVFVMPITQFASDWAKCSSYYSYQCLEKGYTVMYSGTDINFTFTQAEGCAAYVMIVTTTASEATLFSENYVITSNPAPTPTGACAS